MSLAVVLASLSSPGLALPPDEPLLDEVIVTARRVPELAFDLPLAIDVFTAETLRAAGASSLADIADLAPGFSVERLFGASGGATTLRGQSQTAGSGDNVAIFVDGVHQANRSVIDLELFDVERVELIRGPQNSLYGHSAFAGALQVVPQPPTRQRTAGWTLEGGSDEWLAAQGFVSGPLGTSGWLGRLAASERRAGGAFENASDGSDLDSFAREVVAASIARDADDDTDWTASLSIRFGHSRSSHPPIASLYGEQFNCGGRDPASDLWSYYCGHAPPARVFDLSDDMPESTGESSQLSLRVGIPLPGMRLEFVGGAYAAHAEVVRDFDASSGGQALGVCIVDGSCLGSSTNPATLDRIERVNQVLVQRPKVQEFANDLSLRGDHGTGLQWRVGLVYIDTRERAVTGIGAERGSLAANERWVALLPGSPDVVGPISRLNSALVDDPTQSQVDQSRNYDHRRTLAAYGTIDWEPATDMSLRAEVRATRQWIDINSVTANFRPSFGRTIETQEFRDVTPRLSLDYRLQPPLHAYLSAAKGSRSGGINPLPGLDAQEQAFEPEHNWTYEAGLRWSSPATLRDFRATAYYIDWDDTQIRGFATTPGITNLITLNTAGVVTRGIEIAVVLQPAHWMRAILDVSHLDARFSRGSDDPSAGDLCGLAAGGTTSSFCHLGPPRTESTNSPDLVPWLDGNPLPQAPRTSWHGALVLTPRGWANDWQPMLRADLSHQDETYDRGINAFTYGARTLLHLRIGASRGPWSIEAWARNLTDEHYTRSFTSRQAQFFPTSPRPLDFLYGDARRLGLTLRYRR